MGNQTNKPEFIHYHMIFLSPVRPCMSISDVLEFDSSREEGIIKSLTEMKEKGYSQFSIQHIPSIENNGKGLIHVIIIAWK